MSLAMNRQEAKTESCSCRNLYSEWEECCRKVIGCRSSAEIIDEDSDKEEEEQWVLVMNLLPEHHSIQDTSGKSHVVSDVGEDAWMVSALRLDVSIRQMADLLRRKRAGYTNVFAATRALTVEEPAFSVTEDRMFMTDGERSMLESTVASFTVATANQIDSLRQMLLQVSPNGSTAVGVSGHRAGIVSYLFSKLKTTVAEPMGKLQSSRKQRMALHLLQHPHLCHLPHKRFRRDVDDDDDDDLGLGLSASPKRPREEMEDRHFLPPNTGETRHSFYLDDQEAVFESIYGHDSSTTKTLTPPVSRFNIKLPSKQPKVSNSEGGKLTYNKDSFVKFGTGPKVAVVPPMDSRGQRVYQEEMDAIRRQQEESEEAYVEELQRESAYLTASLQNELEDVRKVEERMTEITALLSQFSNLVSEQQEEIRLIHDNTAKSKTNMDKGQDNLVDATKRGEKSKHRMATLIFALGLLLLFFNYITP
uniref:t-SNARE coiled-coil homology domain-containing protein n=1 Tax=Attheya septentrionalis TaxID=420275 RepID=A0A7S2XQ66_9STRA|mmetsp:Transcript_26381/g.47865  ORF Transcript_26381/g.47865 Transcript_26381/m.47865 type:complete len:476 (+) Transcript_26381:93-1520(+)|eukprot:CAMPEP_0198299434 /NCGR_PEP_ID=MMETSP1449-20131203/44755_1 /TAXON_ID=420275 /ORGANISM="Attheya septentrionalis, Strain CCMP2084" /LENGTH=475 /DNA_ID=CAMNT_0044000993 /DNA_START=60 /DNA_END=1487 /DNA_ORIENTATION=-